MSRFAIPASARPSPGAGNPGAISVGDIDVRGNVEAPIVIGNNNQVYNFTSHTEHGVVVNFEAPPSIQRRSVNPQPPRIPRGFVGRGQEQGELEQHIREKDTVLLHGHDGLGKTTLLKKVAHGASAASMPDGVLYLEGTGADGDLGFQDILQYLFDAFFESNPPVKVSNSTAQVHLGNTQSLIILDGFDLPTDSLNKLPDMVSRGGLIVTGKTAPWDDTYLPIELAPLAHQDAIQLFLETSGMASDSSSLPLVDQICTLLDNTPLAIARLAKFIGQGRLTPQAAVNGLEGIRPPSQNKIQSAIERSFGLIYTHLMPEEREMLAAVAAAPGVSVDRSWLESMAGGEQISEALEAVELLQANSPRLRMHDSIKQILNPGKDDIKNYRASLLKHLTTEAPNRARDFGYMTDELGNILGLIQWAAQTGRWSNVVVLGRAVDPYLTGKGLWDAWEVVLNLVLAAGENLKDQAIQAWALHQLGSREIGVGRIPQAIKLLVHALRVRDALGDRDGAAYTRHNLNLILPPSNDKSEKEPREPSGGNSTIVTQRSWVDRIRGWYLENPGWLIPILFGGLLLIAIIGAGLYDIFNNPLELTVQAERQIYTDPDNDAIAYTYSIRNKNDIPLLTGLISVTSDTIESIDCPTIASLGNFDDLLDSSETITCQSVYKITPEDLERGSVTSRARVQTSENKKSKWISTTTVLEPGKPSIALSIVPDSTSYDQPGQEIRYTYTITNTGNTFLQRSIVVTDDKVKVDCGQTTAATPEARYLPPNDTLTCTGVYSIAQSDLDNGSVTNTATAVIEGLPSNAASSTISAKVIYGLDLTTTADSESYEIVGQIIRFTHTLVNKSNITLKSLPIINNDISSNPCTVMDLTLPETLAPGRDMSCVSIYTITQDDLDNGSLTNHASASFGEITSETTTVVNAIQRPALDVAITATPASFGRAGEIINYTYVITNRGNVTLGKDQPVIVNGNASGQVNCGVDRIIIPPDVSQTCTSTYSATVTDIDAKAITNRAVASTTYKNEIVESPPASAVVLFICPGPPANWRPYTVRTGNTLSQISAAFNMAPSVFQEANCMGSSTGIYAGQRFYVPYLVNIGGLVFYDTDKNGSPDGEKGIPNFNVTLKYGNGSIVATTTTGSDGRYLFASMLPGNYWVLDAQVNFISRTQGVRDFGLVPVP